ncbi:MAG: hypothetical protein KDC95_18205 [Planctomycetes bacterium]|nr:hypothetical protein [Planctomycetota bacterium]
MSENEGKPFVIIGVNSDTDLDALRPRLKAENITWRSFWNGPEGKQGPISKAWHVSGWPTVYVIDHRGIIRHKSHGNAQMDVVLRTCIDEAIEARGGRDP